MDTSGLRSPAILAAEKKVKAAQNLAEAAQASARAEYDVLQALKASYWEKNASKFNLEDPEDLMVFATAAWADGSGNTLLSNMIEAWVKSKDSHLSTDMWQTIDGNWDDYKNMLPTVQVSIDCKASEAEVESLADALTALAVTFNAISETYSFSILENTLSRGGSYTLWIRGDKALVTSSSSGSYDEDELTMTVKEAVQYIVKRHPYCSGHSHYSDDDENY